MLKTDTVTLEGPHADAMVRVIETACGVRRRYQFFVWTQAYFKTLLPHRIAVCGAWQRQRRALAFEVFQSVVVPDEALALFTDDDSALMAYLMGRWVDQQCRPLRISAAGLAVVGLQAAADHLQRAGIDQLMLHGVSRPQRPADVESLFLLAEPLQPVSDLQLAYLGMLMPHLHSTYLRMQGAERELSSLPAGAQPARPVPANGVLSQRERQILAQVREGKSNLQIGEQLGISALTVKNHIQKILRKLGASNRAQAVSRAISLNQMASQEAPGPGFDRTGGRGA
jgi:transcriptional regulator EpsA